MGSRVGDVVQGYASLTSDLFERWGSLASKSASRLDAGSYDTAAAAEDMIAGASLATEAACLYAVEWYRTLATALGQEGGPEHVRSEEFEAPKAGARLKLAGPLVKGPGLATLPESVVEVEPAELADGKTQFTLKADASGRRGGTYVGEVQATTADGTESVTVWIVVP